MCKTCKNDGRNIPRAGTITLESTGETWGYDNADVFVKAIRKFVKKSPSDVKWHVNIKDTAVLMAAIDADMVERRYETPFGYDDITDAPPGVKGVIMDLKTGEIVQYDSSNKYVEGVLERTFFDMDGFVFSTCTDNRAVWARLDQIMDGTFGVHDANLLEHSMARPIIEGYLSPGDYIKQRMTVDGEKMYHGDKKPYLVYDSYKDRRSAATDKGRQSFACDTSPNPSETTHFPTAAEVAEVCEEHNKQVKKKRRTVTHHYEKPSVLARLAEKQKIVKEREEAKKRGEIYLQDIPHRDELPFPEAVNKSRHATAAKTK